jgi:hypothetical protein
MFLNWWDVAKSKTIIAIELFFYKFLYFNGWIAFVESNNVAYVDKY